MMRRAQERSPQHQHPTGVISRKASPRSILGAGGEPCNAGELRVLTQLVLSQLTAHPSENEGLLEFTVWVIKPHASDKNIPQNNSQGLATWQFSGAHSSENNLWK